jgi:inner membrane protein CreD
MTKYLGALAFLFVGASVAWLILGGTLVQRTGDSDTEQRAHLSAQWGSPQVQQAPIVTVGTAKHAAVIPIRSSRINVALNLEQRRKGLLWYNLYDVHFSGRYVVRNDSNNDHLAIRFPLPASDADYANLTYSIDGNRIDNAAVLDRGVVPFAIKPGESAVIENAYDSRGMESWAYQFKDGVESINDFVLTMTTNFKDIDFPANTLLPVTEEPLENGWRLQWNYRTLVTANDIGMVIPYPPQPGPLAERITFWAPVALLFYFFVMLLITTLRGIELHPINYFFLACAFFAFHLLFAYLVDRIPLLAAFAICSVVSIFLTISYLRLVVGWRFAALESGLAQLVYLVLFSYALFNEGWSGLTITIGAIITLFIAMQLTGRIRWSRRAAQSY